MRSLLRIKLSGIDYKSYDPSGALVRWAPIDALRKRRTDSTPYGPRKKKAKDIEDEMDDTSNDDNHDDHDDDHDDEEESGERNDISEMICESELEEEI